MGAEINRSVFTDSDFKEFHHRLQKETHILLDWCRRQQLDSGNTHCGLELEAWIVDPETLPAAVSDRFLHMVNHQMVVPELSRYNFEINTVPRNICGQTLSQIHNELSGTWNKCYSSARAIDCDVVAIGSLPTLKQAMLTMDKMSPYQRYFALNEQIIRQRNGQPLQLHIEGQEKLEVTHQDIMLEAAATSLQLHLQVSLEESGRFYNASQILSGPTVAASANNPYLFQRHLWEETRIATFEESVSLSSFCDQQGHDIRRVTFGTGYVQNSVLEMFLENLNLFPILLPFVAETPSEELFHLKLQNGTIWRWNRPIVGKNAMGKPHLRIEHRVMPAPPSLKDAVADLAFYLGAVHYLAALEAPPEQSIPFAAAKNNFYQCAKKGLDANVNWYGREITIKALILEILLPEARRQLLSLGIDKEEVEYFLEIFKQRVQSGQNGAAWQRKFISKYGPDYEAMTRAYMEHQKQDQPVAQWSL